MASHVLPDPSNQFSSVLGQSVGWCYPPLTYEWGTVAQWLERMTDNRVVAGSNPTGTAWKLWQFPLPHFASVFRKI